MQLFVSLFRFVGLFVRCCRFVFVIDFICLFLFCGGVSCPSCVVSFALFVLVVLLVVFCSLFSFY